MEIAHANADGEFADGQTRCAEQEAFHDERLADAHLYGELCTFHCANGPVGQWVRTTRTGKYFGKRRR